ncbi:hypothetical protein Pfo_022939 [Paulownia fortunei]|nr:hypothetical protein Pfo_022939 [Paulownia fortunei]
MSSHQELTSLSTLAIFFCLIADILLNALLIWTDLTFYAVSAKFELIFLFYYGPVESVFLKDRALEFHRSVYDNLPLLLKFINNNSS